ncbi:ABC transporter permease subunit [Haladaptatus sp. GCM10025707]|uniref:ABC transporter permease subunit n=1 Tax=unclassified Haladaptatus TaxID=2622732 RepID=UPI0023E8DD29|nr:ABC transporter permease subunit [Haladaptatus sp. QDMS2]
MSLKTVARKEYHQCRRSPAVLGTVSLFFLSVVFFAAIQWVPKIGQVGYSGTPRFTLALINSLGQPGAIFVPMLGLLVGYHTIAGERESGALKMMLALPHTRRDVVFGKFLGRVAVVMAVTAIAGLAVGVIALVTYAAFDVKSFVINTTIWVLYGSVYVSIAVGFSAWMESKRKALVGTVSLYALFMLGWDALMFILQLIFIGPTLPQGAQLPDVIQFAGVLNPARAFMFASRSALPAYYELTVYSESNAAFLQDWIGFPILAVWVVVPLSLGYLRFRAADIH